MTEQNILSEIRLQKLVSDFLSKGLDAEAHIIERILHRKAVAVDKRTEVRI